MLCQGCNPSLTYCLPLPPMNFFSYSHLTALQYILCAVVYNLLQSPCPSQELKLIFPKNLKKRILIMLLAWLHLQQQVVGSLKSCLARNLQSILANIERFLYLNGFDFWVCLCRLNLCASWIIVLQFLLVAEGKGMGKQQVDVGEASSRTQWSTLNCVLPTIIGTACSVLLAKSICEHFCKQAIPMYKVKKEKQRRKDKETFSKSDKLKPQKKSLKKSSKKKA